MTNGELISKLKQFELGKRVGLSNDFHHETQTLELDSVVCDKDSVYIKPVPFVISLDIGVFMLLKQKELLLDEFLDSASSILANSAQMSKEKIIEELKRILTIKIESPEELIPES